MPRRHVGGHVVEAVDVHLEQRGERQLDGRGEHDDDSGLHANDRCLPPQQHDENGPRADPESALEPVTTPRVEEQYERDPPDHDGSDHTGGPRLGTTAARRGFQYGRHTRHLVRWLASLDIYRSVDDRATVG